MFLNLGKIRLINYLRSKGILKTFVIFKINHVHKQNNYIQ